MLEKDPIPCSRPKQDYIVRPSLQLKKRKEKKRSIPYSFQSAALSSGNLENQPLEEWNCSSQHPRDTHAEKSDPLRLLSRLYTFTVSTLSKLG